MLQMLRAGGTQRAVLRSYERAERLADGDAEQASALDFAAQDNREPTEEQEARAELLRTNIRGVHVSIASIAEGAGLSGLAAALRMPVHASAVMTNTIVLHAVFECGAKGTVLHVRGAEISREAPWYSFIRYRAGDGSMRLGHGARRLSCRGWCALPLFCGAVHAAVDRAPRLRAFEYCVHPPAWEFDAADDEWPRLETVEKSNFVCLEQVHVDWHDMSWRHGQFATPTLIVATATKRRATRFFTSVFFPWTTRAQTLFE